MTFSGDSGETCAGTEEPAFSTRSMHRRVKQREGRARRRAARREKRSNAKEEFVSGVDISSGEVAAVASNMAESSPIMGQSPGLNNEGISTKCRKCKRDDNDQIGHKEQQESEAPKGRCSMHHQETGPTIAGALRRRPGPAQAQRNMRFFRELFKFDTRPSDWDLVCGMRGEHAEFPYTDEPVPFGKISAIVWEIEYMAADVIDRPLSGFKEVKRLYAEKTKKIALFKGKLANAKSMSDRVVRNFVDTYGDKESANDYRSLKYAESLLAYLLPILEAQQKRLHILMEAIGKAYSQLKASKRLYKQQYDVRESVKQLKQRQLELQKQIQEEDHVEQQRTNQWISEWERIEDALTETKKSLISDEDFGGLPKRRHIDCQAYELMLRDRLTKTHLCSGKAVCSSYDATLDSGFGIKMLS